MMGLGSTHTWVHIITISALAIVIKEYLQLRQIYSSVLLNGSRPFSTYDPLPVQEPAHPVQENISQRARVEYLKKEGSSIWCWGKDHTDRICQFRNLCYLPEVDNFIFLHAPHSIQYGVPQDRFDPTLLDMSSVLDHNAQYFNYVDVPVDYIEKIGVNYVDTPTLIFKRFNPDNLMHVFHDDLLPMYYTLQMINGHTLENISASAFDVQLVFMEGWNAGDHFNLYEAFSNHRPLVKQDLTRTSMATCFRHAFVGLLKSTVWYQYGFREPQGPVPGSQVTALELRQFTYFLKHRLKIPPSLQNDGYVVLLSRKFNRVVLNEVELTLALVQELKLKVITVGTETHSMAEIISIISEAAILIGMHGSLLSLAMFLPPGSILLEIFPYAVNPDNYTPYKTLAQAPGMGIRYQAWRNMDVTNTVPHPERPWDFGGITHLPPLEQERIKNSKEVAKHLCCRDPEWLYRIYQDTIVDIPSFITLLKSAMADKKDHNAHSMTQLHDLIKRRVYPAEVHDLKCTSQNTMSVSHDAPPSLWLSWQPPWNIKTLTVSKVKYEVWIQEQGQENYTAWILMKTGHHFTSGLKPQTVYNIWVCNHDHADIVLHWSPCRQTCQFTAFRHWYEACTSRPIKFNLNIQDQQSNCAL